MALLLIFKNEEGLDKEVLLSPEQLTIKWLLKEPDRAIYHEYIWDEMRNNAFKKEEDILMLQFATGVNEEYTPKLLVSNLSTTDRI